MCPPSKEILKLESEIAGAVHTGAEGEVLTKICRIIDKSGYKVNFIRVNFEKFQKILNIFDQAKKKSAESEYLKLEFKQLLFWLEENSKLKAMFYCSSLLPDEYTFRCASSIMSITDRVNEIIISRCPSPCPASTASFKSDSKYKDFLEFNLYVFMIFEKKDSKEINCEFKWDLK